MKQNPINLTIPPGARIISIGFGESIEGADDSIRAAFAKAEKDGVATIALHEAEHARKATGLDILRMRGTPIEMIYSTLMADDIENATAMFRTSILEYIFEKIAHFGWGVSFINSKQLHRRGEQLGFVIDIDKDATGKVIALTPEHDTLPFQGSGIAKLCNIESGRYKTAPIGDDGNTTVMGTIETLSGNVFSEVSQGISNANLGEGVIPIIHIVVDLCAITIEAKDGIIEADIRIPMVAYAADVN
jgi:hypothetical protein